ncbi:MAG: ABC transporter permease [Candidatus Caldarchaeum sp.]
MVVGLKLERRLETTRKLSAAITAFFIILAMVAASLIFETLGVNSYETLSKVAYVFTTPSNLMQATLRSLPIMFAALGLCLAFKMNFWNIGAEGQIYMGGVAATGVVLLHANYGLIPPPLVFPAMILAAFMAGGLFCALPAYLRARLGVNEILPTLMLNYVAMLFVRFLAYGPWRDPKGFGFPLSITFPDYARMDVLFGQTVYMGLPAAVVVAALLYGMLQKTRLGFEMRVLGQNLEAARYAGVKIGRTLMLGSMVSGGLAGLGGLVIVSGILGRLRPDFSPGYGYTAIIIAFLAALNPWIAVPASIFFGGLLVAGDILQATLNLQFAAVQIFQSTIFLMIILGEFFKRYRVRARL